MSISDDRTLPRITATGLVRRQPLLDRLSAVRPGAIVVVCAPAGSGKTELLRSWVQTLPAQDPVAWVSVERGERDAQRFWISLIHALSAAAGVADRIEPAPAFHGEALIERALDALAAAAAERSPVLLIDDLHELHAPQALAWLERFLARLPPWLRVVLATREDLRLGLHRARLAGELSEVRGDDLPFTVQETRELLRAAGIALSERGVALLHERTEGWAAGLRLAALSLARHRDPERFVAEFSGSERTVADYLLAEVLERQPPEVRELMLRTSILTRVSGPLADALTGGTGAERILQELEDDNAFVTSLDVGRTWFRYHHLFGDLLRLELRRIAPARVPSLHRAAALWHAEEGDVVEAVHHAQTARDWTLASRLLGDHHFELVLGGRGPAVRDLLGAFPDDVAGRDPEVTLVFATVRLLEGDLAGSAAYLAAAEHLRAMVPDERAAQVDLLCAVLRLVLARWRGDLAMVLDALPRVEAAMGSQAPADRLLRDAVRSVVLQNLGTAELWAGRFEDARAHLEEALTFARRSGRHWLEISPLGHLAFAGAWTGLSFSQALQRSEEAVSIAEEHGWGEDPIILTALAAGAICLLALGRLAEADAWLDRAMRTRQAGGERAASSSCTTPAACGASRRGDRPTPPPTSGRPSACRPTSRTSTSSPSPCEPVCSRRRGGWATRRGRGQGSGSSRRRAATGGRCGWPERSSR